MTRIPQEYIKAGKIARELKPWVKPRIKPGTAYVEISREIEREIERRGGTPAFPTGIGVNQVAAHFAPQSDEAGVVREEDVVKVDFGVHVDGYIADTATTVTYNPQFQLLVEATERSLQAAVEVAKRDRRTGEIGRAISAEAAKGGFKPISNLSGHTVERYTVHAGKSIPNLYVPNLPTLKKEDVFAIEPFLTLGEASGYVVDGSQETIFSLVARKKTGNQELDELVATIWERRKTLPFTPRWFEQDYRHDELTSMLKNLEARKLIRAYRTLVEASNRPVAQFEHTVAISDDGIIILT